MITDNTHPFLFRYLESEKTFRSIPNASPERGESNKLEEEPPKEPSKKTPQGD